VRAIPVLPPPARPTRGHQLRAGPTDSNILFLPPSPLVGEGGWGGEGFFPCNGVLLCRAGRRQEVRCRPAPAGGRNLS
jgi:hypothetical protein